MATRRFKSRVKSRQNKKGKTRRGKSRVIKRRSTRRFRRKMRGGSEWSEFIIKNLKNRHKANLDEAQYADEINTKIATENERNKIAETGLTEKGCFGYKTFFQASPGNFFPQTDYKHTSKVIETGLFYNLDE